MSNKLGPEFRLLGLKELSIEEEIPEDFETLEENASQKAWYIYKMCGINCIADVTGLEVEALNGEPGVFSARYSRIGEPVYTDLEISQANIMKLLDRMKDQPNRRARFKTVISLIMDGTEYHFEGIANGTITQGSRGTDGFGYDPVFVPEGHLRTFAEMDLALKNTISHRARAVEELVKFLKRVK